MHLHASVQKHHQTKYMRYSQVLASNPTLSQLQHSCIPPCYNIRLFARVIHSSAPLYQPDNFVSQTKCTHAISNLWVLLYHDITIVLLIHNPPCYSSRIYEPNSHDMAMQCHHFAWGLGKLSLVCLADTTCSPVKLWLIEHVQGSIEFCFAPPQAPMPWSRSCILNMPSHQ